MVRSGWWKARVEVALDGVSHDFDKLPEGVERKIMAQMKQGAVAGAFEIEGQPEPKVEEDQSGVCPVCGGELRYTYEVRDADGNAIPGREF